ncbi:hypothetical protein K0M31_012044 [Melipona bicolor]|uniref:Uncharacterized protein n=1 Tax=Melipona bicolor TaxID=60889 RepID=A0AA40GBZ2_9HYME|nr:hypothetical protein K0M31_012044 [Melipona bicolor]
MRTLFGTTQYAAIKPAQTRAVEKPAPQFRSTTIQRAVRAESVDALDNEILDSSHNIKILQTQCLLETTHENNVTAETAHIHNSLPGFNSKEAEIPGRQNTVEPATRRRASEQEHLRAQRSGDPHCHLVGEYESIRREPTRERDVRDRESVAGTLSGRRGERKLLVLQFELAEDEELDDIRQLVRLQPR